MTDERKKPVKKKSGKVVHKLTRSGNVPSPLTSQAARANVDIENEPLSFEREVVVRDSTGKGFTWRRLVGFLIGIVLLGVVGYYGLVWIGSTQPEVASKPPASDPVLIKSVEFKEDPLEVALSFVNASDPQSRLKLVRNPDEVEERLSQYPEQALKDPVTELAQLGVVNQANMNVAGSSVVFEDGSKRNFPVVATEEGSLIDWDSYARYCSASWSDLLSGEADVAEVRVFAKPVAYYNYEFEDGNMWDGFQLSSPDLDGPVFGYAKEGTLVAEILNSTLPWTDSEGLRMTLRILSVGDSAKNRQFLIDRVLAYDWVRGEQDLQDTWVSQSPEGESEE